VFVTKSFIFLSLFYYICYQIIITIGVGLYIAKSIIEANDGETWSKNNKDGMGATFWFSPPLT